MSRGNPPTEAATTAESITHDHLQSGNNIGLPNGEDRDPFSSSFAQHNERASAATSPTTYAEQRRNHDGSTWLSNYVDQDTTFLSVEKYDQEFATSPMPSLDTRRRSVHKVSAWLSKYFDRDTPISYIEKTTQHVVRIKQVHSTDENVGLYNKDCVFGRKIFVTGKFEYLVSADEFPLEGIRVAQYMPPHPEDDDKPNWKIIVTGDYFDYLVVPKLYPPGTNPSTAPEFIIPGQRSKSRAQYLAVINNLNVDLKIKAETVQSLDFPASTTTKTKKKLKKKTESIVHLDSRMSGDPQPYPLYVTISRKKPLIKIGKLKALWVPKDAATIRLTINGRTSSCLNYIKVLSDKSDGSLVLVDLG